MLSAEWIVFSLFLALVCPMFLFSIVITIGETNFSVIQMIQVLKQTRMKIM